VADRAGIISELGLLTADDGDRLRGEAQMVPELCAGGAIATARLPPAAG
jgi:hypothetical protein